MAENTTVGLIVAVLTIVVVSLMVDRWLDRRLARLRAEGIRLDHEREIRDLHEEMVAWAYKSGEAMFAPGKALAAEGRLSEREIGLLNEMIQVWNLEFQALRPERPVSQQVGILP